MKLSFGASGRSVSFFTTLVALLNLFGLATAYTYVRHGSDPSVMQVNGKYYSVESAAGGIWVRAADSLVGLGASNVQRVNVWSDKSNKGEVWAPEIVKDNGRTWILFSAGVAKNHRMYGISADQPLGPYTSESKVNLPDDQWAIDGTMFNYGGQRWFAWSGWADTSGSEQNLYICRMSSPVQSSGARYIISQPRESWERASSSINEGPEAIIDPNGQLHIVYSADASWTDNYCLADLRLRKGGDPTYVWDWYKSNGCLFGSHQDQMMQGWDATLQINGPGHHSFDMPNGDITDSPGGTVKIPFSYHGVPKGTPYSWENREVFAGTYVWWSKTTYSRKNVPGANTDEGYSFKFFE